ncbi:Ubiquitin conjugation factor E4 A-like [Oopsacas minuta]|uniref:RING-type E3 ubiquitin transferase n=1 Tax=Oopsacas minuta TaxID=111878 RepID=A0AAV7KHE3_9METZ|nr:Ubiquitin conjugation factor E4 A-like [Oopsacas minuta]
MATDENPFKRFCPKVQLEIQRHYPPNFKVLTTHFPTVPLRLNATLEDTFGFTLCHPDIRKFLKNIKYLSPKTVAKEVTYLPYTATQSDQGVYVWHPLLSLFNIEVALNEYLQASSGTKQTSLNYLFSCFVRLSYLESYDVRTHCIPLVHSAVARSVTSGSNSDLGEEVMKMCRMNFVSERATLPQTLEFLTNLIGQLSHEEMCRIFTPILLKFSEPFISNTSPDVIPTCHFVPYSVLFSVARIAQLFTSMLLDFRGLTTPLDFEFKTILGPLFRVSPINTYPSHFKDASTLTTSSIEGMCGMLNQRLTTLCEVAHQTFKPLFKHNSHSIFLWLSLFLKRNHPRGSLGLQLRTNTFQQTLYATDGMGLNVTTLLLKFCQKLCEGKLVSKINSFYCLIENNSSFESAVSRIGTNPSSVPVPHILELCKESKLCHCEDTEDLILDLSPDFSFPTQLFHVTHFALSVYYVPVIDTFINKSRQLAEIKDILPTLENQPLLKATYEDLIGSYLSLKSHLLSENLVQMLTQFCLFSCDWFLFLTGTKHKVTPQIACIPEFYLSNVLEILQFLSATCKDTLVTLQPDYSKFIQFSTVFLNNSDLILNPHKRGKIAEVLGTLTHSDNDTRHFLVSHTDRIRETLQSDRMALRHFLPGLLKVFAEIEVTGDDLEFEQKFTYRHSMYDLIELLWSSAPFKPCLDTLCREVLDRTYSTPPVLLKFLNALINDATFLLDEGLSHVQNVAVIEKLKSGTKWHELSEEEKNSKITELGQETRLARTMNRLAERTIHTLVRISHETPQILTIPVQIDSLATMLNYFLNQLTGPKNRTLNVLDREQLSFKPLDLLCHILEVYFNMAQFDTFLIAVVSDGRSYSESLLINTQKVLGVAKAPFDKMEKWQEICGKFSNTKRTLECNNISIENIPEEFLDALMNTLMSDPILLPSGNVVDRATIERHILNQKNDPFSRQPLSIEELEPIPELKERIEKWQRDKSNN